MQPLKQRPRQPIERRKPYTQIACVECRRRKVRCGGQEPCRRCKTLDLDCHYESPIASGNAIDHIDSRDPATLRLQVASLQVELQAVSAQLTEARKSQHMSSRSSASLTEQHASIQTCSENPSDDNIPRPCHKEGCHYDGPASIAFSLEIVRDSLQSMGIVPKSTREDNPADLRPAHDVGHSTGSSENPLNLVSREEALRLCRLFAEEANLMYPFLNMEEITNQVNSMFTHRTLGTMVETPRGPAPSARKLDIIFLVLAIALVIESNGDSSVARFLFSHVKGRLEKEIWSPVTLSSIKSFALVARYYFYADEDDTKAWRTIGIAARQCLELGLHHADAYAKMSKYDSSSAIILFWSIFALDRRWSFGAGLPFTIQEEDIDPALPEPAMIPYCRISSKVWFAGLGTGELSKLRIESLEVLDSQVLQWQKYLPEPLQCSDPYYLRDSTPSVFRNLQVQMYVRTNIMRILIYRPVLYSPANIAEYKSQAMLCVRLAKDVISVLHRTAQTTNIYRKQQALFNFFILSSLAIIILACFHAPAEFCGCVQGELSMALELVKGLNSKGGAARRLWKVIRDLRTAGERVGVFAVSEPFPGDSSRHTSELDTTGSSEGAGKLSLGGIQVSNQLKDLLTEIGFYGYSSGVPSQLQSWEDSGSLLWTDNTEGMADIFDTLF